MEYILQSTDCTDVTSALGEGVCFLDSLQKQTEGEPLLKFQTTKKRQVRVGITWRHLDPSSHPDRA